MDIFGLKLSITDIPESVEDLRRERDKARANKKFKEADEIRAKIKEFKFYVSDSGGGSSLSAIPPEK